jgi:hypothetical protein
LWLVLAVCFGIGVLGRRDSINASCETAARMFGRTSKPISRTQWVLIFITSVPLLLFGAAVVVVHFFLRSWFIAGVGSLADRFRSHGV